MRHVCIVGAGLAGVCAAFALVPTARVTLLEASRPAGGASGVAAGLVNPFMGQKALPLDAWPERLAALTTLLDAVGLPAAPRELVRPAPSAAHAPTFAARAEAFPDALRWHVPRACAARWPEVAAPYGALVVRAGRSVDVGALVARLAARLEARGGELRTGPAGTVQRLDVRDGAPTVRLADGSHLRADVILFCTGGLAPGLVPGPPLHPVKGQIVRLYAPSLAPRLPLVSGDGYLVPEGRTVLVGSTFEHAFADLHPTPDGIAALREKAAALVPALADAELVDARAGLRVSAPGRQPVLGPLPGAPGVWVFNGLGAKGLLTAPWLAQHLPHFLDCPAEIPAAFRRALR